MKLAGIKDLSNKAVPVIVIREIALSVGIDIPPEENINEERISRMVSVIERAEPVLVSREFTGSMRWLEDVASFVNRGEKFKKKELLIALEQMVPFLQESSMPSLPTSKPSLTFGPKTRSSPLSYDACMLFRLCSDRKISTTRSTTMEELSKAVMLMSEGTSALVGRIMVLASANGQTLGTLVNCIEMLSRCHVLLPSLHARGNFLTDTDTLLRRITPQTKEEAVVIGARTLGINIERSSDPLREVLEPVHPWVPLDERFRKMFLECPWMFSLTCVFQEDLVDVYSHDQSRILQESGFVRRGEDIPGSILLVPGIHPSSPRETLITKTSVEDAGGSFFSIRDGSGRWHVHTLDDLLGFWDFNEGVCLIPGTTTHLPQRLIGRLGEGWGLQDFHHSVPSRKLLGYRELLQAVVKIDLEMILRGVSDIAFFMRGWTGESMCPLPLSSIDTLSPPEASADIDEKVQKAIISVESRIMSLPVRDQESVLHLPLVWKYDDNICDLVIQGARTLDEKFREVREAKDTTSCIRMSSNVLLFTVFFFRDMMRISQEYQLDEIGIIS